MTSVTCSCCGIVPERGWVNLLSHRDIVICYDCLDWLNTRRARQVAAAGGGAPIIGFDPAFSVADVARAVDHYQRLGFRTSAGTARLRSGAAAYPSSARRVARDCR